MLKNAYPAGSMSSPPAKKRFIPAPRQKSRLKSSTPLQKSITAPSPVPVCRIFSGSIWLLGIVFVDMIAHDFFPHNAYSQTDTLLESSAQLSLSAEYCIESVHSQMCFFSEVLRSDTVITIVDVLLQEVDNLFICLSLLREPSLPGMAMLPPRLTACL